MKEEKLELIRSLSEATKRAAADMLPDSENLTLNGTMMSI